MITIFVIVCLTLSALYVGRAAYRIRRQNREMASALYFSPEQIREMANSLPTLKAGNIAPGCIARGQISQDAFIRVGSIEAFDLTPLIGSIPDPDGSLLKLTDETIRLLQPSSEDARHPTGDDVG